MKALKRGTYRNGLGATLTVTQQAGPFSEPSVNTIGGDIWLARRDDGLLGPKMYLVTARSMTECGYELVGAEGGDS